MVYQSYWDDSEDVASGYFGVGGFVGQDDVWGALGNKWLAALPEGIDYFHATDCFSGNNQFEPEKGFPKAKRIELLDRLTDLVCEADIKLVCSAIDVPHYVHLAGKRIENDFLGNQYVACLSEGIIAVCRDYMNPVDEPYLISTGDICTIFYEDCVYSNSVSRAVLSMRQDPLLEWRGRIGDAVPGTKKGRSAIPLLQVADLGAFIGTKKVANAGDGAIPWKPYYEKLYRAGRVWRMPLLSKQRINFIWAVFGMYRNPEILDDVWPVE